MKFGTIVAMALGLWCATGLAQTKPQKALQSGEQVYRQVCAACHASGVAGAPALGDAKAWKPLIAEGQGVLTAHAWVGVRAMPAQGGAEDLKLEEFARAVAWMARNSGGEWKDPDAATMKQVRAEAAKRLDGEIRKLQKQRAQLGR
jgi:cytochrome c5